MILRSLAANEVDLHREVRLHALRDAPDSFGETLEDAAARPRVYWEQLTFAVTQPGRDVMFLACEEEDVLGAAYGMRDPLRSDGARVGGMWVDLARRRRGVGRALLLGVFAWARERGLQHVGLWAPAHGEAALALYSHAGFRQTGERRPLPAHPSLSIVAMEAEIG
jgi:GNAT superfamily N-acetyltransferase